jgi:hypothetical protein
MQPNGSGIGGVTPIVLAINVKGMQMFTAPIKDELEDGMQLGEGGVTADEEAPPDEGTDVPQDDTEPIDAGQ